MTGEQERRVLSLYAGVSADDVARIEHVTTADILTARSRCGRDSDGHPPPPSAHHLNFEQLDAMMRSNRSAQA